VTDGYLITGSAKEIFGAGKKNDVPTLTGSNADENGASPQPKTTAAQFKTQAQTYGDLAAEFLKAYPAATDDQARAAANDVARDRARVAYTLWAAERAENSKSPAYLYFWNHVLPGPDASQYGAFHTSEVPYVFNSLDSGRPFTDEDRRIGEMMSSYWATFAAHGDPNGRSGARNANALPHWPSDREQRAMVMQLGDQTGPIPAAGSDAKLDLLKRLIAQPARRN
jgi:para-nitrobenzyl esterase